MTQGIRSEGKMALSMLSMTGRSRAASQTEKSFESYLDTGSTEKPMQDEPIKDSVQPTSREEKQEMVENGEKETVSKAITQKDAKPVEKAEKNEMVSSAEKTDEPAVTEAMAELVTAVMDLLSEMAEDVLSVSPQDVEQWMITHEMSLADMLDPQNLRQLVMDLNGLNSVGGFLIDADALGQWNEIQDMLNDFLNSHEALLEQVQTMESTDQKGALFLTGRWEELQGMVQEDDLQSIRPASVEEEPILQSADVISQEDGVSTQTESTDAYQTEGHEEGGEARRSVRTEHAEGQMSDGFLNRMTEAVGRAVEVMDAGNGTGQTTNILNQIVSEIRFTMSQEVTSMDFMLNPENLGRVHISVADKGGVMTAQITVQSLEAREALESQMIILQQTFEEQGLKVESVEVNVSEFGFGDDDQTGSSQAGDGRRSGRERRSSQNRSLVGLEESEEVSEEERLTRERMNMTGAQVDYSA